MDSTAPAATTTRMIAGTGGAMLAVHETGPEGGRPLLMLHGLFSSADTNWIRFGHAALLAAAGHRCIMPDLRAHGRSDAPHDPAAYAAGVLVEDARAVIAATGLADFDLAGFSLGARLSAQLIAEGLRPRRAALCGMGWEGLSEWDRRRGFFLRAIAERETAKRGDDTWLAIQFMKTQGIDPVAAALLLGSFTLVDTDALAAAPVPVAVICGSEDSDNGSAAELARRLADARHVTVPGTHMSSVTMPELGKALVAALA